MPLFSGLSGKPKEALFYELGPPNVHPMPAETDGLAELVWDGRADEYGLLPFTRSETYQLFFLADPKGAIVSGKR